MNKYLLYILFFTIPLFANAQTTDLDTVIQQPAVTDSIEDITILPGKNISNAAIIPPVYTTRKFESNFKNKYRDEDFVYNTGALPKTLWQRFLQWLGELLGNGASKVNLDWLGILFKILAFVVISFVIYLIVRAVLNKESIWIFGRSRKNITVQEAQAENIHEMDFARLINDTKTDGNYRLALRYYYLWVLKKLSVREIIDWNWDKTNTDYLYEIKDTGLRNDFKYLSYVYDHSWYGDFPVDEKSFTKAEKSFKKTLNTL